MATVNPNKDGLLVQIASYNTNLQGILGLPQDLVDWLSPTLQVSKFLSGGARAPDIVAVGFQELLPLHLGLAGLSKAILDNRNALILSQIEAHAPNKEKYSLVAKIANVGIALLVYARDDGVARRVTDVQTAWTGCGPGYMGNKGAVGIRFRVAEDTAPEGGETFTFVNCHLTPFNHKVKQRLNDYKHIVSTLLFPPSSGSESKAPSTLYDTSHLFVFGDMNFRVDLPATHPLSALVKTSQFSEAISSGSSREELKEFDQLTNEKNKGNVFVGLHEGEFWKFKCSYKYKVGEVDQYSVRRIPSWTDRILYATHKDTPDQSAVKNLLYTSIPSYTTSDHKPIITLLLLPPRDTTSSKIIPKLTLPSSYHPVPDPNAGVKRWTGRVLDRFIGVIWWVFTLLGAGSGLFGFVNFFVGLCAFTWWKGRPLNATNNV